MSGMIRTTIYLFIAAILMAAPSGILAQADETGTSDPASTGDSQANSEITFAGSEDASLFVGYYRLNPGDTILVEIITEVTRSYYPMIDDEGNITIPVIGPVHVADLTLTEARDLLQKYVDEYYLRAWVTCRVSALGQVKFFVYGDIDQPGFYTAGGATTFLDFLQTFGLASSTINRRIVHVRSAHQTALPEPGTLADSEGSVNHLINQALELYRSQESFNIDESVTILDPLDFSLAGEIDTRNFYLEYGDVIYIPDPEIMVQVQGFRRSGVYEVLPGETWLDIINLAGTPGLLGNISNLLLERHDETGNLQQIYYNLNMLTDTQLEQISLENRDNLMILQAETEIYILGEVSEPGALAYEPTLTPLDYIAMAGGATSDAHLTFTTLIRPPRDPRTPLKDSEVFQLNLVETINEGQNLAAVAIEPGDIIYVPDKGEDFGLSQFLTSFGVLINAVRLFD